jgi:hypothetical protein
MGLFSIEAACLLDRRCHAVKYSESRHPNSPDRLPAHKFNTIQTERNNQAEIGVTEIGVGYRFF